MTTEEAVSTASDEHEDPSLSSASLCIQFNMLGETFGPVFTHQAFPGEWIRGYHPPLSTLKELTDKAESDDNEEVFLHSSHRHHEHASKELSILVTLAPSCEKCHVKISIEQKRLPRRQSVRASKRRRIEKAASEDSSNQSKEEESVEEEKKISMENNDTDEDEDKSNSEPEDFDDDDEEKDDDSEFEADGEVSEIEGEDDKEGSTRKSRMPTKEILQAMKKGLPMVTESKTQGQYLRRPLGVELKEYSVKGKDFVLCLASGSEASKYHSEVQRLALWFIETADDVDLSSQEGGFWKVLYLFQKHKRTQYSLAGYTTLFHFHAPFKKPKAGYVVRICQALVLPPFQRAGHGKQMLTCIMDIANGKYTEPIKAAKIQGKEPEGAGVDNEIVEINVECPAPAFVMLRNRTDYDCFLRSIEAKDPWFPVPPTVTEEGFFTALPEPDVVMAAAKAKIIPRQIQIVQELYKLQQLQEYVLSEGEDQKDELEKRFRLMVKKRLNKEHREDLSAFRTKAEKQAFLEEEFKKCMESYQITLPKT